MCVDALKNERELHAMRCMRCAAQCGCKQRRTDKAKLKMIISLLASVLVALASGTPYLYGVYAPQLVKRVGLTALHSATISLASNIGSGIGGFPAGLIIDAKDPPMSILIGSICIMMGYFGVHEVYVHRWANMPFICVAMVLVGFGSIISYFATIKAAQANFPKHRGSAGAIPVSGYGLSATIFSVIAAHYFKNNTGGFLGFLALFCGSVTLLCSYFVQLKTPLPPSFDEESALLTGTDPTHSHDHHPPSDHLPEPANSPALVLLTSTKFFCHYLIVSVLSGIGQMYIYSVGFVVSAQVTYAKSSASDVETVQALQVGLISIASFSGRLLSGIFSDILHKKFKLQRLWIVLTTTLALACGQLILVYSNNLSLLAVTSAVIGGSYGLIFGTYPAIMADEFGTDTFSTTWGLICTGPLITLYILNKYFGRIFDSNTDANTGVCYLGNNCYRPVFQLSFYLGVAIFFVAMGLMWAQRKWL